MSALDDFFADLDAEYATLSPPPKRTMRARVRAAVVDARYWLATHIDPYGSRRP